MVGFEPRALIYVLKDFWEVGKKMAVFFVFERSVTLRLNKYHVALASTLSIMLARRPYPHRSNCTQAMLLMTVERVLRPSQHLLQSCVYCWSHTITRFDFMKHKG